MPGQRAETAARDRVAPTAKRAAGTHAQPRRPRGRDRDARRDLGAPVSTGSEDSVGDATGDTTTNRAQISGFSVRDIMHARLKAMAEPRQADSPELARLRQLMRDPEVAADLAANVDQWPAPTDEQREVLGALLQRRRPGR